MHIVLLIGLFFIIVSMLYTFDLWMDVYCRESSDYSEDWKSTVANKSYVRDMLFMCARLEKRSTKKKTQPVWTLLCPKGYYNDFAPLIYWIPWASLIVLCFFPTTESVFLILDSISLWKSEGNAFWWWLDRYRVIYRSKIGK